MRNEFYAERFYHPELNTLRFLAFLGVFVTHAFPHEPEIYLEWGFSAFWSNVFSVIATTGTLGVDLFFCLSSFLITAILLREFQRSGKIDVPAFWMRRILRIWPLYFLVLGSTWLLVPYVLPNDDLPLRYLIGFALFYGNWVCVLGGYPQSACAPLWSIAIEEQFYFAWPLILSRIGARYLRGFCAVLLAIGWTTRWYLVSAGTHESGMWCNTLCHLDSLALGALCAVAISKGALQLSRVRRIALTLFGVALPTIVIASYGEEAFWIHGGLILYPAAAIGSAAIVVATYSERPRLTQPSIFARSINYLGVISYGLYVFHFFAILLTHHYLATPELGLDRGMSLGARILAFFLTVMLAMLSYRAIERPFLRIKERFARS